MNVKMFPSLQALSFIQVPIYPT